MHKEEMKKFFLFFPAKEKENYNLSINEKPYNGFEWSNL